jgi:Domain of unknown function (DUF4157)
MPGSPADRAVCATVGNRRPVAGADRQCGGRRRAGGLRAKPVPPARFRIVESHVATHAGGPVVLNGNEIQFMPGTYQPHSGAGREMLAHQLAYVAVQRILPPLDLAPGLVRRTTETKRKCDLT